jgi:hypothetical protein
MYDHRIRLQSINDRHAQEFREAALSRSASRAVDERNRRPVRAAVGRSLVRLGNALAAESEPAREPARYR